MYTKLDLLIIISSALFVIFAYVYLKVTGEIWYGINWRKVFDEIRVWIAALLLKIFNK